MKNILMFLFLAIVFNVKFARAVSYESAEFKNCVTVYSSDMEKKYAIANCEKVAQDGQLEVMLTSTYNKCVETYTNKNEMSVYYGSYNCLTLENKSLLHLFENRDFLICKDLLISEMKGRYANENCITYYRKGKIQYFSDKNFMACEKMRSQSMKHYYSVENCMEAFNIQANSVQKLTLEEVSENIQIPENSQVILTAPLQIPGNNACASVTNGDQQEKCWVCRAKKSRNDVLYLLEKDQQTGVDQKILPVDSTILSPDGKQISFNLVQDPTDTDNLSSILCTSKNVFQIKQRSDLIPMLEKNGLKLIIPAAKEK